MAVSKYLYGPMTWFGIGVAAVTAAVDQAVKLWLLFGYDIAAHGTVRLGPFIDIVLVWNPGISYGLFPQVGPLGQWALLGVKAVAVATGPTKRERLAAQNPDALLESFADLERGLEAILS